MDEPNRYDASKEIGSPMRTSLDPPRITPFVIGGISCIVCSLVLSAMSFVPPRPLSVDIVAAVLVLLGIGLFVGAYRMSRRRKQLVHRSP